MILSYKYRIKGRRRARLLQGYAHAVNKVWNFCVDTQKAYYRRWRDGLAIPWPSSFTLSRLAGGCSQELGVHSQSIQNTCVQFVNSRDVHGKCPKYRASSGSRRSLGWVPFQAQSRRITRDSLKYLGNTFRWFGAKRRPLPDIVKGGEFVEDARGRWYVCLQVEVPDLAPAPDVSVGIDLGIKSLATLSTGEVVNNPRVYSTWERRLATAQRAGNTARVRAIHAKITNIRTDHLHKASARIAASYRTIAIGNVSSSQLARTRLSKSVTDASWSTFRNQLRYKASRHGGRVVDVDEKFTTQTCSSCGALPPERPRGIAGLGIREWECSACGSRHDRDVNAARNILMLGLSVQLREDESRVAL